MWSKLLRILDNVRRVFVGLVFLFMIVVFIVAINAARPSVPDQAVLVLDPKGPLVEELAAPGAGFPFGLPTAEQARMRDLVRTIHAARDDKRIRILQLDLKDMDRTSLTKCKLCAGPLMTSKQAAKRLLPQRIAIHSHNIISPPAPIPFISIPWAWCYSPAFPCIAIISRMRWIK